MKPDTEKLRKKYINTPPEGMTSEDIRRMSEDDLLDMDYFLNEDDPFNDDLGKKVFTSSKPAIILFSCPNTCLSNICSINMCSFLFSQKSQFPIK